MKLCWPNARVITSGAAQIVVDSGNNQTGILGQPLPFPFVVDVVDAGYNRVAGVSVKFNVKQGGGSFGGVSTVTINTDSNGRALAVLTTGLQEGINNNVVEATFDGNPGLPAAFVATAKSPGDPASTTISGVVLDNSNNPIPGATIRLYQTNQGSNNNLPVQIGTPVQTNAQGTFQIINAPVGSYKLMADGTTAQGGTFPTLEYDIVTIAGTDNTVGMPIYLPALDTTNQLCVDSSHGGTLTLPQFPGFALTVQAGSATFPGGSKTGCISVTPVNGDKVPMSPGFGQQPRFIVTIQPVGTTFNPPAPITLPNVDGLPAKSVTEMYSYDHDLGMFVAIGTGTVSDDGSLIRSNAGVGVLKAGWHCGGNPNSTGSAGTCPTCQKCQGSSCGPDTTQDTNICMTATTPLGVCLTGNCTPLTATVSTVTFSGDHFKTVVRDTGTAYGAPQWTSSGDHFPVAYTGGTTMSVSATFQLSTPANGGTVQVTGTTSSGFQFQGSGTMNGNTITLATTAASGALKNGIGKIDPLTIQWKLTINGKDIDAGASSNKIYLTLNDPTSSTLYETLLDIGARSANGATSASSAVSSMWTLFTTKRVARVDGVVMGYWTGGIRTCQSLAGMLASAGGDGSCVAWSQLFHQTLEAQGITGSEIFEVTADPTINSGANGFLVKNWKYGKHIRTGSNGTCDSMIAGDDVSVAMTAPTVDVPCITPGANGTLDSTAGGDDTVADGIFPGTSYPYLMFSVTWNGQQGGNQFGDVANQPGIAGQNNAEPPPYFGNHFIVEYGGSVYDPSYGAGPFTSELAHENAAIDGIMSDVRVTKNNPTVKALQYQHVPGLE